jgi:transcriptional regulator with XRE-family HTH domain
MATLSQIKKKWLKDPAVKKAYDAQSAEFETAKVLITARLAAGYSQQQVAEKMGTTQSVIARMEGGEQLPSYRSIMRYAEALGAHVSLKIQFDTRK